MSSNIHELNSIRNRVPLTPYSGNSALEISQQEIDERVLAIFIKAAPTKHARITGIHGMDFLRQQEVARNRQQEVDRLAMLAVEKINNSIVKIKAERDEFQARLSERIDEVSEKLKIEQLKHKKKVKTEEEIAIREAKRAQTQQRRDESQQRLEESQKRCDASSRRFEELMSTLLQEVKPAQVEQNYEEILKGTISKVEEMISKLEETPQRLQSLPPPPPTPLMAIAAPTASASEPQIAAEPKQVAPGFFRLITAPLVNGFCRFFRGVSIFLLFLLCCLRV